ncbi:MAG: serine hydrolase [Bacteroidetes bacterium]|nr:serine hydrolase [Bacteroidota bacterium]
MKTMFSIVTLIVFFGTTLPAQKTVQGLNDFLVSVQKGSSLPGYAVAIVKEDQTIFSGAYGMSDKSKKIPYSLQTIQPSGGISRTIIALALMKAVDNGYFTLETPVNDVLPFKIINPNFPSAIIRVKDIATGTSGIADNLPMYNQAFTIGKKPSVEMKDFLKGYFTENGAYYDKANFCNSEPGKKYAASNVAAAVVAYMIELKSKMSFDKFTTQNIFAPLKMTDTHWIYDDAKSSKYATLYQVNRHEEALNKYVLNSDGTIKNYCAALYPATDLRSSVNDLAIFLKEMIKGYSGKSIIISKKSFELLFQKQFAADKLPATMDPREPNRAIFWAFNRKNKIAVTGGGPGYAAFIAFDPITKVGHVLLLNTDLDGIDNITTIEAFVNLMRGVETFELGK